MSDLWICLGVGLLWWVAAIAVALPFRCRRRPWLRWLRPTVGLPLTLGAMVESSRSRSRGARRTRHPYRGFTPFLWALVLAKVIVTGIAVLVSLLL